MGNDGKGGVGRRGQRLKECLERRGDVRGKITEGGGGEELGR